MQSRHLASRPGSLDPRRALIGLMAKEMEGHVLSGNLDKDQILALPPQMIVVNTLIEGEEELRRARRGAGPPPGRTPARIGAGLQTRMQSEAEQFADDGASRGMSNPPRKKAAS
jgi:hypothetical protein